MQKVSQRPLAVIKEGSNAAAVRYGCRASSVQSEALSAGPAQSARVIEELTSLPLRSPLRPTS
jgi:hypothetical protein